MGVQQGGLKSAEALLLARYFMYSQVYFHPVRRIYDIHLKDFLTEWLMPDGRFSTTLDNHLRQTDVEVTAALRKAADDPTKPGHKAARHIIAREHYRELYRPHPKKLATNPKSALAVFEAALQEFGSEHVKLDLYKPKGGSPDFPVRLRDGQVVSSLRMSEVLSQLPTAGADYVFISPEKLLPAEKWLKNNREKIIQPQEEGEEV